MKKFFLLFLGIAMVVGFCSCEKWFNKEEDPGELNGDPSPMAEVGVNVSSSSAEIAGVSNFQATVTALNDGVSSYSGSATVTNQIVRDLFTKIPGITANGNTITGTNIKLRQTTDGIELLSGPSAGILFKYSSEVGDSYPIGSTGKVRTVVSKTGQDDYYYGFLLIKTIQVEETSNKLKSSGISKITYIGNHRFGLVGFKVSLNDGTSVNFPVYTSAENK
jgi:hypothetical protein